MKKLAAAIPFDAQGRGLFDVNIKYGCRVTPIGGKVDDADASTEAAAVREAREEFGLLLRVTGSMGEHNTVSKGEGPFPVHTFACEVVDDSDAVCEGETVRAKEPGKSAHAVWLSLQELFALGERNMLAPNLHSMIMGWRKRYVDFYGPLSDTMTLQALYEAVEKPFQGDRNEPDEGEGWVRVRFRATSAAMAY